MSFVSATVTEGPPTWQPYLDMTNDVKPWLQVPAGSNPADVRLSMLTNTACVWVQNYLNRPIAPTTIFRRFDGWSGWNGAHVMLPYFPILPLPGEQAGYQVQVVEFWGSSGAHVLQEQTPENQGFSDMFQVVPSTGRITRTFMGLVQRPFFPGSRNVEVTWVAGFNPTPDDIKFATLVLIQHWWEKYQQASRSFPVPAGANPDVLISPTGPFMGIPAETERLLQPYKQLVVA